MQSIDLHLPKSWNQCTLGELRAIAEIIVDCQQRATPFRPFNIESVKVAVFFRLTGLIVVKNIDHEEPIEKQFYLCRLRPYSVDDEGRFFFTHWRRLKAWIKRKLKGDDTFPLYAWMISSWLTKHKDGKRTIPGKLDWLDNNSGSQLLIFPYSSLKRRKGRVGRKVKFHGPAPLMDGFTWQRYRFAQDYMEMFTKSQNRFLQSLQKMDRKPTKKQRREAAQLARQLDDTMARFLATIFTRRIHYVDKVTGKRCYDFHYEPGQTERNMRFFRGMSGGDWQLVTLWWSGMMHWLGKTYPKVFKTQSVGTHRVVNPLELYTRTTATLEKYLHTTAHDIDNEPYTTILQQLDDITRKNEQMEEMNRKMKK